MSETSSGKRTYESYGKDGGTRKRRRSRFSSSESKPVPLRPSAGTTPTPPPPPIPALNGGPLLSRHRNGRSRFSEVTKPPIPGPSWRTSIGSGQSRMMDITAIPVAPVATLRINRDKAMEKRVKGALKLTGKDMLDENPETNPYFDSTLAASTETRRTARSAFNFVEQGTIAARADKLRARAEDEAITQMYREKIAEKAARNSAVPEIPPFIEKRQLYADASKIPSVEWWDAPYLTGDVYGDVEGGPAAVPLRSSKIHTWVQHAKRIKASIPQRPPPVQPLMLTAKERKRLRRQRRQERTREERELIAVGLKAAPPPKVKLSNMMRVLAEEATADPTRMEMQVRAQVAARRAKHEEDNEMRRRTKEESQEKRREAAEKDRASGLAANVYRLTTAENPQHRFKVVMNARQLGLSGALVLFADCNVVVVEGGAKALAKFRKLMLRRIDWSVLKPPLAGNGSNADADADGEDGRKHEAVLVWEGAIASTSFLEFRTIEAKSESGCRQLFKKRRVEHYWDVCVQASPTGDATLGRREC